MSFQKLKNVKLVTLWKNQGTLYAHKSRQLRNEIKVTFELALYRPYWISWITKYKWSPCWWNRMPGGPLNRLFESCLIYCSQVAVWVNIRADDVVLNTVYMRCLLIIVKRKKKGGNRKLTVHKTEFSFLIGPFFRQEKSIQLSD